MTQHLVLPRLSARPAPSEKQTRLKALSEKFVQKGQQCLSDVEMLQLALRIKSDKAQEVLDGAGGLNRLVEMDSEKLRRLGVNVTSAVRFLAGVELQRRATSNGVDVISCPADAWPHFWDIRTKPNEHFCCLYLDARHVLKKRKVVSVGSVSASIVHPREVFEEAITGNCSAVILGHNHPSGVSAPSREDIDLTKRLVEAGRLLGIEVCDHLVVTAKDFLSMKEHGLM